MEPEIKGFQLLLFVDELKVIYQEQCTKQFINLRKGYLPFALATWIIRRLMLRTDILADTRAGAATKGKHIPLKMAVSSTIESGICRQINSLPFR